MTLYFLKLCTIHKFFNCKTCWITFVIVEKRKKDIGRQWTESGGHIVFFTPCVNQFMISFDCLLRDHFFVGIGMEGEILVIHNVSRFCDGVYQCVASNDVPPAVEMETKVIVECK